MPITATKTREDIRLSVGRLIGAVKLIEADASGSTTTFLTDDLAIAAADDFNGKWLIFTSGQANIDGSIRQVTDSSVSSNRVTLTFYPALTNATADGATAEMWDQTFDPAHVHSYIQQSILDVSGRVFDPTEDISLHTDSSTARFDIPTTFEMLNAVQLRTYIQSIQVHDCDSEFDETSADSDFVDSLDDEDKKQGSYSLKITSLAGNSAGDFLTDSISSVDLSKYTHIEGWVKSTVTLSAADYKIHLDSGTVLADGSDLESLDVPAVSSTDTWTFFRIALSSPEADTAIISIGIEMDQDKAAHVVWFDDIRAVNNDTAQWEDLSRHLWHIDKEARDLILTNDGVCASGYYLMKLKGGDLPLLLDSDTDTNEVPDSYLIYRSAGLALLPQIDERDRQRAQIYLGLAEREAQKMPMLVNARFVT
jgi:hypothetical protein